MTDRQRELMVKYGFLSPGTVVHPRTKSNRDKGSRAVRKRTGSSKIQQREAAKATRS